MQNTYTNGDHVCYVVKKLKRVNMELPHLNTMMVLLRQNKVTNAHAMTKCTTAKKF